MKTIEVDIPNDLGGQNYPIFIGNDLFSNQAMCSVLNKLVSKRQLLIVTDSNVAKLHLENFKDKINKYANTINCIIVPAGESSKSTNILNKIYDILIEKSYSRDCMLLAFGGGVIGDLCGFAAASYHRGVDFIQIPTTLVAQADSSVGGKTGINHLHAKNMIGAFWQPKAVIIDFDFLQTLPMRELKSGLAEVIKYSLIFDIEFFEYLENNIYKILKLEHKAIEKIIFKSCMIKVDVVKQDEQEQGIRSLLNLGHTFGHAIESIMGYGSWLHGEAISAGMLQAAYLSFLEGNLKQNELARIEAIFTKANLPIYPPHTIKTKEFLKKMAADKKVIAGNLRLILLKKIGEAYISNNYKKDNLMRVLKEWQK